MWPNPYALQRTRRERRGCNRGVPCAGSLSLGRSVSMLRRRNTFIATLLSVVTGCKVERGGVIDFANPMFDLQCGPVVLIAFPDETVLHVGRTYFMLSLPFYVPVGFFVLLFAGLWFVIRRSRNADPRR